MDTYRLKKLIIPFGITILLMMISYFGNQLYAEYHQVIGKDYSYIFYDFNIQVPFISWTIYPYIIAYPFWFFGFIYLGYRSDKNLYIISTIAIISFIICGVWYLFWQSDVEAWRVTSGLFVNNDYAISRTDLNFTESIVMFIYRSAGPRNALPSMHTINSWILIVGARLDKKMPKGIKILIFALSLSIIIATQTLKQHYIIDLIAGVAIAESLFWIVFKSKIYLPIGQWFDRLSVKWHIIDKIK